MGTKDTCNTTPAKCLLPASVLKVLCKAPKNRFNHSCKNVEYIQDTASTARISNKLHPHSAPLSLSTRRPFFSGLTSASFPFSLAEKLPGNRSNKKINSCSRKALPSDGILTGRKKMFILNLKFDSETQARD